MPNITLTIPDALVLALRSRYATLDDLRDDLVAGLRETVIQEGLADWLRQRGDQEAQDRETAQEAERSRLDAKYA